MGESVNLIKNFKVDNVIFNKDTYNDLELELVDILDNKGIKHYKKVDKININNHKLYFLNTKRYDNENDNSNIIYTTIHNYKLLFMGDAGVETEKEILKKYDLKEVNFLKVGHHGSDTSTSKEFVDAIKPDIAIISVGKNNMYNHPKNEVLERLNNSKIYRTDEDGSITFKIKNNKLKMETCSP